MLACELCQKIEKRKGTIPCMLLLRQGDQRVPITDSQHSFPIDGRGDKVMSTL